MRGSVPAAIAILISARSLVLSLVIFPRAALLRLRRLAAWEVHRGHESALERISWQHAYSSVATSAKPTAEFPCYMTVVQLEPLGYFAAAFAGRAARGRWHALF